MAFTKVVGPGIHTLSNILSHNINSSGIITATKFVGPITGGGGDFNAGILTATSLDINGNGDISGNLVVGGNLTANGDFTTLNTTLREVELLRVDAQDDNVAAGIITQRGTGDIFSAYDTSTEVFKITDGGRVFIGESSVAGSAKFVVGNGGAENFEFTPGMASSYEGGVLEYIHRGDGNTRPNLNFYVNNTGAHKFWTAGSERLSILSNGKVGINTTDIPQQLTVFTAAGYPLLAQGPSNGIGLGNNGAIVFGTKDLGSYGPGILDGSTLEFKISGNPKLNINSSGVQVTGNVDLAADGDTILLGTGDDFQISFDGTNGVLKGVTGVQNINVWTENTAKYQFTAGSFRPLSDNSYDLGDSSLRWRNLYTQDLQLSNKAKGGNDVDETWGDWTLQEGENDIFMINNRNGKKYKINLTEVS